MPKRVLPLLTAGVKLNPTSERPILVTLGRMLYILSLDLCGCTGRRLVYTVRTVCILYINTHTMYLYRVVRKSLSVKEEKITLLATLVPCLVWFIVN